MNKLILIVGEPALNGFMSLGDVEWDLWSSTIRIFVAIAASVSHFSVDISGIETIVALLGIWSVGLSLLPLRQNKELINLLFTIIDSK